MIVIICSSEDRAIQIFDVLNNRGLPLNPADILKATLMRELNDDDKKSFSSQWKQVETDLGKRFGSFLAVFAYYFDGKRPSFRVDKSIIENIKKDGKITPTGFVNRMQEFSKSYKYLWEKPDRYLHLLKYLNDQNHWTALLTTAHYCGYKYFDELKKYLVILYYQNWLAGFGTLKMQSISYKIIRDVKDNKSINDIKEAIKEYLIKNRASEIYKENLKQGNIDKTKRKALLALVEYFSKDESIPPAFIDIDDENVHLEHILPKTSTLYWRNYFPDDENNQYVNSLGNLTLLLGKTNKSLSKCRF